MRLHCFLKRAVTGASRETKPGEQSVVRVRGSTGNIGGGSVGEQVSMETSSTQQ